MIERERVTHREYYLDVLMYTEGKSGCEVIKSQNEYVVGLQRQHVPLIHC